MKLISWNVNGLRACSQKGFYDFFDKINADIFCVQETKMQEGQMELSKEGYHYYMNSSEKKGYSGTLIYTKEKPLNVIYGINEKYNDEGRVITLEFNKFYLVNAYVPNAQDGLKRIDYRMIFEDDLRMYLKSLNKPVIYCGDLNVANNPIDLKNPKANEQNVGYSIKERRKFNVVKSLCFDESLLLNYVRLLIFTLLLRVAFILSKSFKKHDSQSKHKPLLSTNIGCSLC